MADTTKPKPRRRSLRRRLSFIGILLVVLWLLLELISFAVFYFATGERFSPATVRRRQLQAAAIVTDESPTAAVGSRFRRIGHPYLGFVGDRTPESNPFGFLGKQSPVRKRSPDRVIIGILGGSVAYGFHRSHGTDAVAARIRHLPRFRGKEIEFVSLALPGFKQPQQLLTATWIMSLGGEFDCLINIDGYNDIVLPVTENLNQGTYPFFPRAWNFVAAAIPDRQQRYLVGLRTLEEQNRQSFARTLLSSPSYYSPMLQTIWTLRDRVYVNRIGELTQDLLDHRPEEDRPSVTGPGTEGFTDENRFERLADFWQKCSIDLMKRCHAKGTTYLHFLQPNQYLVGSKPLHATEQRLAYRPDKPPAKCATEGYPILRARGPMLRAAGVQFHDLTQLFATITAPIYIDDCCHFNHEGNRLMGERIAEVLATALPRQTPRPPQGLALTALECPTLEPLTDPLEGAPLMVRGRFVDGSIIPLEYEAQGTTYHSSDTNIASVSKDGVVIGLRTGRVRITIRHANMQATTPVQVNIPRVLDVGTGVPGTDDITPRLTAIGGLPDLGNANFALRVTGAPRDASGWLAISTELKLPSRLVTQGSRIPIEPAAASSKDETRTIEFPYAIPDAAGMRGIVYAQAYLADPGAPDGLSRTSVLRIEIR